MKIKPLEALNCRKVHEFCPSYFETTVLQIRNEHQIIEWIDSNLSNRYYVGPCNILNEDNMISRGTKIGFESPKEMSYFMLACPFLR